MSITFRMITRTLRTYRYHPDYNDHPSEPPEARRFQVVLLYELDGSGGSTDVTDLVDKVKVYRTEAELQQELQARLSGVEVRLDEGSHVIRDYLPWQRDPRV